MDFQLHECTLTYLCIMYYYHHYVVNLFVVGKKVQIKTAIIHKQNEISTANSIKDNRSEKSVSQKKFLYALQGHLIGPFPSGGPKYDIR